MSSKFAACDESFFGINCIQKCAENCHNRACHHETGECLRFHMVLFLYFNIVHINIKFTALRQSDNLKICCIFLSFFFNWWCTWSTFWSVYLCIEFSFFFYKNNTWIYIMSMSNSSSEFFFCWWKYCCHCYVLSCRYCYIQVTKFILISLAVIHLKVLIL